MHGAEGGGRSHEERGAQPGEMPGRHPDERQHRPQPEFAGDDQGAGFETRGDDGEPAMPGGEPAATHPATQGGEQPRRRRRRGRRGGRRRSRRDGQPQVGEAVPGGGVEPEWQPDRGYQADEAPVRPEEPRYPHATPANPWGVESDETPDEEPLSSPWNRDVPEEDDARGNRLPDAGTAGREAEREADPMAHRESSPARETSNTRQPEPEPTSPPDSATAEDAAAGSPEPGPRRRGWWRRRE